MVPRDWAALATRTSELVLIAGPNGSGKTTIAQRYVRRRFPLWPKLDADRLLLGLERTNNIDDDEVPALQAAKIVDTTAHGLSVLEEPFVLETVLSSTKYQGLVSTAKRLGTIVRLVYVTTSSPRINIERVHQRTLDGGHDVPRDKIIARWHRSMENLVWFAARADRLVVYDNSGSDLELIAARRHRRSMELYMPSHPAGARLRSLEGRQTIE